MNDTVINRTTLELRADVDGSKYDSAIWIINPDLSAVQNVPPYYWKISGDNVLEMDASEKAAQDVALGPGMKAAKIAKLEAEAWEYAQSRYPLKNQVTFSVLWTECVHDGLNNRYAYIKQGMDWSKTIYQLYYQKAAEIMACTTLPAIEAVTWDYSTLTQYDPCITVYAAMQIPD